VPIPASSTAAIPVPAETVAARDETSCRSGRTRGMNTKHTLGAGIGAFAILIGAGLAAHGALAGTPAERSPALPPFDRIQTRGAFRTTIVVGRAQHVVISGDAGVIDRVTATVDHGRLDIGMRDDSPIVHALTRITIELPALRAFSNQGAGTVAITGVTGGALELANAGAARMRASGSVGTLAIELDGIGAIDTTALDARDASVDNNGVGRVDVRASGTLTMNVNGVGEIRYAGHPASIDRNVNGIGRIAPL